MISPVAGETIDKMHHGYIMGIPTGSCIGGVMRLAASGGVIRQAAAQLSGSPRRRAAGGESTSVSQTATGPRYRRDCAVALRAAWSTSKTGACRRRYGAAAAAHSCSVDVADFRVDCLDFPVDCSAAAAWVTSKAGARWVGAWWSRYRSRYGWCAVVSTAVSTAT